MTCGPDPWQQRSWDWRAAGNFVCGGAGSGLVVFAATAGAPVWMLLAGAALVALGLLCVWLEIGRPWRALHVFFNPRSSWMSREAIVAPPLLAAASGAAFGVPFAATAAAVLAVAFVWCQARILRAAKGIPAWREPMLVPLVVATALAEGGGLLLVLLAASGRTAPAWSWLAIALALAARFALWRAWRSRIRAAPRALAAIDRDGIRFRAATLVSLAVALAMTLALAISLAISLVVSLAIGPDGVPAALSAMTGMSSPSRTPGATAVLLLQAAAGVLAVAGGACFKATLVTRGAFNQGFAIVHLPVRGVRRRPASTA